ncbi:hypothetical protein B0H16DRAFT_897122 [Mycena metata]|uniref:Uncharacterized protein n=1 Tax=Mycena metata TaxID=1033252 RepID=A0AAD7N776_9AGAR|nr:hypothetical protein B0H16DRAFT_897122 [Mycena metata]
MSNPPEQPKSKFRDSLKAGWLKVEDVAHKGTSKLKNAFHRTPKHSPAPSPQRSRSPTPAPSSREGPPPGAIPTNPESAPSRVDNGEDSSKGGDPAQTDTSTPSEPDLNYEEWKIDSNSISQLRAWGAGHENSNWRKLAERIDHSLKSKTLEAVQDFIPDSPFPAKTLVKALVSRPFRKRSTTSLRKLSSIFVLLSRLPVGNQVRGRTWRQFVRQ